MIDGTGSLLAVLPADFILLIITAFLFSIYQLKIKDFNAEQFLKKRFLSFVTILGILFLLIYLVNYAILAYVPESFCQTWEEGCQPFTESITHWFVLMVLVLSIYFFILSVLSFKLDILWHDIHDKRKKNKKFAWFKFLSIIVLMAVVAFGILSGSWFIFIGEQNLIIPTPPVLNVYTYWDENSVIFHFKNNSTYDKLISRIDLNCHLVTNIAIKQTHQWDFKTCSNLPKIFHAQKIEMVYCDFNFGKGCEAVESITAHLPYEKQYTTIFKS